jgi:DNA polymerase IV
VLVAKGVWIWHQEAAGSAHRRRGTQKRYPERGRGLRDGAHVARYGLPAYAALRIGGLDLPTAPQPSASPATARLVAHLDMDAFYASVELLRYPELAGRPVVIGGGNRHRPAETIDPVTGATIRQFSTLQRYAGRGVVTTATYAARALGVHSAMGLMKAAALAPGAVLLPTDFDAYRRMSARFKAAVRSLFPLVEDRGIDEIYIDLSEALLGSGAGGAGGANGTDGAGKLNDRWAFARQAAAMMKRAVHETTGLSCSVAVAPNKLLAKIASDLEKPDGLVVIRPDDLQGRIWPLPVRRINGIGPKSDARLQSLGIHTIGDLAGADPRLLVREFGASQGSWMHDAAHGRDERPVVTHSEPRSISRETTFERDLHARHDRAELSLIFTQLCERVSDDLVRKGYAGRTIGLKLRYDDFRTVTRDHTLAEPTQDPTRIRRAAGECLKRVPLERRIRLLGVRIGSLHPATLPWPSPALRAAEATPAHPMLFD